MKLCATAFSLTLAVGGCGNPGDATDFDGTWVGTITTEGNVTTVVNESGSAQSEDAFGFRIGEERRYVLEPAEALSEGEFATWSIRFEGRRGVARLADFKLRHVRNAPVRELSPPETGRVIRSETEATLNLNPHGFPEDLVFTVRERLYGQGEDVYTVRYSYDGDSFLKEVWTYDKDWSIRTPIATTPDWIGRSRSGSTSSCHRPSIAWGATQASTGAQCMKVCAPHATKAIPRLPTQGF